MNCDATLVGTSLGEKPEPRRARTRGRSVQLAWSAVTDTRDTVADLSVAPGLDLIIDTHLELVAPSDATLRVVEAAVRLPVHAHVRTYRR